MNNESEVKTNVFNNKNFLLVFLGSLVSDLGSVIYSFVVGFYILEISNNNAFLQGVYLAICSTVLLVVMLIGGVLCDRYNKAKIMYFSDFAKGICVFLSAVGMMIFPDHETHIVLLFIIGILGNIASGLFSPASTSLLPHIVEDRLLQQANAVLSIKSSVQSILGIIIAGILYNMFPPTVLFMVVGVCYVISGISELFVRYSHVPSQEQLTVKVMFRDMKDGLVYLKTKRVIMIIIMAVLFINFFFAPITSNFVPYFVKTDLTAAGSYLLDRVLDPEMWLSVISVIMGAATLIGATILAARPRMEKCGRSMVISLSVVAADLIAITLCYWFGVVKDMSMNLFLIVLAIGSFIIGVAITFTNIPVSTVLMKLVDSDKLGKVSSITSVVSQALVPISSVVAGFILQYMGSTMLLAVCTAGFVRTVVFLLTNREIAEI